MVYVNKKDEVRFHCFGACKGDWDITDLIMLRNKYPFQRAQQVWAEHLGVADFTFSDARSTCIPEPDETAEPDEPVGFVEPKQHDLQMVATLNDATRFYHDLLMSNKDRFGTVWDYLARRGVGKKRPSAPSTSATRRHTAMNCTMAGHSSPTSCHGLKRIQVFSTRSRMLDWSDY